MATPRYISSAAYYNTGAAGDLEFRNILKGVIDEVDESATFMDILELTDRFVPTTDENFFGYTNDFQFFTVTVAAAGGATVSNTAVTDITVTDAAAAAKLKPGSILEDSSTGVQVMVDSVSGTTVSCLAPTGGSRVINNDAVLSVPYDLIPEGSSTSSDPETDLIKRQNRINVIESAVAVTDFRTASATEVTFVGGGSGYIYKDQHDLYQKHKGKEGFNFLMSQYDTYDAQYLTDFDTSINGTRGMDSYIADYGGTVYNATNTDSTGFTGLAGFDELDMATFSRTMDKQRAPKEMMLLCGGDFGASFDKVYKDLVDQSGVDFSMFGEGSQKQAILELGVKGVHLYDRTWVKVASPTLDHKYVTSVDGSVYAKSAYAIPAGKIKTGAGMVDRLRGRYLDLGQYANGRLKEKVLGGLAPGGATEATNKVEWRYTSWVGPELNGTKHFGKFIAA